MCSDTCVSVCNGLMASVVSIGRPYNSRKTIKCGNKWLWARVLASAHVCVHGITHNNGVTRHRN